MARKPNLPVLDPKRRIKPSQAAKRRAGVLVAVHVLVALHLTHWWLEGTTMSPLEPSEAMELSKHSIMNAGFVFFAAMILLTAVAGRFFCGWACHVVALQDLARFLLIKVGIRPRPLRSRLLGFVPMAAFIYMFLWPVAYRLWIGDSLTPVRTSLTTTSFWATFPGWAVALATFAVCGFAIVYFLGAKGFCTYACPYGAIFGVAERLAPIRIRVTDACEGCGHCTATCSSNVRVHEEVRTFGMVVDPGCMKCLDCVSVCPNDALYLGAGKLSILARVRQEKGRSKSQLEWSEELTLAVSFIAALFSFRGLYGVFPFLLSLGWSAILAYLCLLARRLWTRENLRLRTFSLKRAGRLLPAGRLFVAAMVALASLWIHSGLVQYHGSRAQHAYAATTALRSALIDGTPRAMAGKEERDVARALGHFGFIDRWALRSPPLLDLKLAWLHLLEDREDLFRARSEKALAKGPQDASIRIELALYLRNSGRFSEAANLYRDTLEIEPRSVPAVVGLGLTLAHEGRLSEAGEIFERGINVHPEVPELHYNAALADVAIGDALRAVERFEKALALRPDYLEARENLAGLLCGLGRFEEGIQHFEVALRQSGDDATTRLLMARAYLGLGDLEKAGMQVERALELEPDRPEARALYAELTRRGNSGR